MGLFSKKEKKALREAHSHRYEMEYMTLPSVAAFAPVQLFSPDNEGSGLIELILDKKLKETGWAKSYAADFCMKIYSVAEGQISLLRFSEPATSPELMYAAVPLHNHMVNTMRSETDLCHLPFYVLARVADKWCIGEIKADKACSKGFYYPVYYTMVNLPDPIGFMRWVMEREGFSKNESLSEEDPVEDFLYGIRLRTFRDPMPIKSEEDMRPDNPPKATMSDLTGIAPIKGDAALEDLFSEYAKRKLAKK